ncbi:hypothetical protein SmJEL517_g02349 [Synchytrium microbalum]|uniref:F-BAR domain-containing protein n=1 Tax=Synchytrium microbalum TaxID=1806994 RepID=A0A507C255_9FUNG|nr:uncharacterized protein SmJEL517_g02349 [Synchytrium microbalum]TPX35207.1 hypothetical protein SmJEL517_g02349 [Synchytrium microbalum]
MAMIPSQSGKGLGGAFEHSFWGESDKGLDQLMSRLRSGKHVSEELASMLKERASIEEDYGKRLAKLTKTYSAKEEIGTLRDSLDVLQKELDGTSKAHLELANAIRVQLERPLNDLIAAQSTIRKNHTTNIEKHLKNKSALANQCQKAKERYEARCVELNSLRASQSNAKPDQLDKIRTKIDKTQTAMNQADGEYIAAVEKTREAFSKWQDDFRIACVECQKLEVDRIEFLRNSCWNYANLFSKACVQDDEASVVFEQACERIRTSLERCDIDKDIVTALEKYSTGSTIPLPPTYINFYTNSSERPSALPLVNQTAGNYAAQSPRASATAAPTSRFGSKDNMSSSSGVVKSSSKDDLNSAASRDKLNVLNVAASNAMGIAGPVSPAHQRQYEQSGHPSTSNDNFATSGQQPQEGEPVFYEYDPWDIKENIPTLFQVRVLYDYQSQAFEELSVTRGQVLPVITTQDDGW